MQGINEGIRQGIQEAKLDMIKLMHQADEKIEKIALYTGLSEEEIKK